MREAMKGQDREEWLAEKLAAYEKWADARSRGLTWNQIGELLGVSGREARQKYDLNTPAQGTS